MLATHDYEACNRDELSLQCGDIILDVRRLRGGWWEGNVDGRRGLFPKNFAKDLHEVHRDVGLVGEDLKSVLKKLEYPMIGSVVTVISSYTASNNDELNLTIGDRITITDQTDDEWWHGRIGRQRGLFPASFVTLAGQTPVQKAVTLYEQTPTRSDELPLRAGDVVTVLDTTLGKGWWVGELHGVRGVFDSNLVKLLPPDSTAQKAVPASRKVSQRFSLEAVNNEDSELTVTRRHRSSFNNSCTLPQPDPVHIAPTAPGKRVSFFWKPVTFPLKDPPPSPKRRAL